MKRFQYLFCLLVFLVSCTQKEQNANKNQVSGPNDTLKLNQIQILGTHNSYAMPIDSNVIKMIGPMMDEMMKQYKANMTPEQKAFFDEFHPNEVPWDEGLSYDHPTFKEQLNAGLRGLEIDVFYDPTGNRFSNPAAYKVLEEKGISSFAPFKKEALDQPGFKVLHIADIDFRSHYPTFKSALEELKEWSLQHPEHIPIFVMVEAKDKGLPLLPNPTEILPFDKRAFDELDQEIVTVLGREKIITPDDVRGTFSTLEEAILMQNWPSLAESKGKFVFMILPSAGGSGRNLAYLEGHPVLENRMMFIQSEPGKPYSAFILLDNSIVRKTEIQELVKKGYLVRTRSDIETYEAKVNDYTRAQAAFESGAQVISTDFFKPGNIYGTNYIVKLPGGKSFRKNPVNTK